MVTIAALVCDRASRARLRGAVRDQADISFCTTVPELVSAVADGAATAVVTEWRDATGSTVDEAIRLHGPLERFLAQDKDEAASLEEAFSKLAAILRGEAA